MVEGPTQIVVNLPGFVGKKKDDTEEAMGYLINTAEDLWDGYPLDGKGLEYPIVVKYNNKEIARVFVKLI